MISVDDVTLGDLLEVFGHPADFTPITSEMMPQPYKQLLAHPHHMTATLEDYWDSQINVHVLKYWEDDNNYTRLIYLTEDATEKIVEYGAVNLNLNSCSEIVRKQILARQIPLGRILINNGVLTDIRCRCFFSLIPTAEQRKTFGIVEDALLYGRFADVDFNGQNAMTLLEVMPPGLES